MFNFSRYVKIGKMVMIQIQMFGTGAGGSGQYWTDNTASKFTKTRFYIWYSNRTGVKFGVS